MAMAVKVTTGKDERGWHVYAEAEHDDLTFAGGGKVYLDLTPAEARKMARDLTQMADDCDERTGGAGA